MNRSVRRWLLAVIAALVCVFTVSALADSNARIVRLSDVQGDVKIDRMTGQEYERAFLNMPITQGVRLWAGDGARAEVEFEDGSTIHLTPDTILQFTDLSLRDSGAKVSTVDMKQGQAYFAFAGKKDDEFKVTFVRESLRLTQDAHLRANVGDASAEVAVLKGNVDIQGPSGQVQLSKNQTVTFDLANNDKYEIAKNVEKDPFDEWDKKQTEYHDRYYAKNSYDTPYRYGVSDLNYYGNYYNVPGYGYMWRPYFVGAGWDPFLDGAWMWYPGFGYSWVSAYPWGWTPYHCGSWLFVPNYGWMWRPGNTWVAWNGLPPVVDAPRQYVPPRPPTVAGRPLVVVGRGPTASGFQPKIGDGSKIVLRNDSAGVGVPRGVRNLGNLNRQVESKGMATLPTRSVPRAMTPGPAVMGRPEMGNMGRVGIGNREAMGAARGPRSESRGERNSVSSAPRMGGSMSSGRSSSGSRSSSSTSHR
jgi:FecR protein